jgi:hypothetical protein
MSTVHDMVVAACARIMKSMPKGDPSKLGDLAQAQGDLSTAFHDTTTQTSGLTARVTAETTGAAADAFEQFANRHSASMAHLSKSAQLIQAKVKDYAKEVQQTKVEIADFHSQALGWEAVASTSVPPGCHNYPVLAKQLQELVDGAAQSADRLTQRAHDLVSEMDKARVSPQLPAHSSKGFAFNGTYKLMGIHPGVVWPVGTHFRESSDALYAKVGSFFSTAEGAGAAFGDDPAGQAIAQGYRSASAFMTTEGNAAAERLGHIGSGLHGMVQRHNEMQNRVTGHMDDTRRHLDALTPLQPQIATPMQRAEANAAREAAIAAGVPNSAAPHHAAPHGTHPLRSG